MINDSPPTPPTPVIPPIDPKDQLLTRQLQDLTVRLGRLPTVNEACAEISRDRTAISAILRSMRLEAERRDLMAVNALTTTVGTLTEAMEEMRTEIQRQCGQLMEQGRLLEAARDASWRHRRDLTNARLALAVLARLTEVPSLHEPRYGALVAAISRCHFAPVSNGLSDGQDGGILAKLAGTGSIAAAIADIERPAKGTNEVRPVTARPPGAARTILATPMPKVV